MKPIPGETVMSIIYGPATTGHLVETSKFLGREIDVWTKDRLIIINGGCEHRNWRNRPPVLGVAHKKIASSSGKGTGGHFTLTDGTEPRNPDAGRQPNNCAFDVVSDQTGYPATALRRLVAQLMLIRLYRSRLRGRGHRLQCSRCSISGGAQMFDLDSASTLYRRSRDVYGEHPHYHLLHQPPEQCDCTRYERMHCARIISYPDARDEVKCFISEDDIARCLVFILNSERGQDVQDRLLWSRFQRFYTSCRRLNLPYVVYNIPNRSTSQLFQVISVFIKLRLHSNYRRNYSELVLTTIYPTNEGAKPFDPNTIPWLELGEKNKYEVPFYNYNRFVPLR